MLGADRRLRSEVRGPDDDKSGGDVAMLGAPGVALT
jgi:hypothetical protein